MATSTASTGNKRKIEEENLKGKKSRNRIFMQTNEKTKKRKIPKDPKSGLPLCRKYMENKECDVKKCRFAHLDRHLRPQCPEFSNWGLCSYGDESCFLVHSRSVTNPLSKYHKVPHCLESNNKGDIVHINPSHGLEFPIQRNFKYPVAFQNKANNTDASNANDQLAMDPASALLQNYPYICVFSVASGFLSRFLSRFSEVYPIDENNKFSYSDTITKKNLHIQPIEAFRGFTKSASNDTIGVVFVPSGDEATQNSIEPLSAKSPGYEHMFPLATEVLTSRHSRDEVLFLSHSSASMDEAAKHIFDELENHRKLKLGDINSDRVIIRVKAFPPARKFSHSFAIQFLLSLAKHHEKIELTRDKKVQSFSVLFPTVDRKAMYTELQTLLEGGEIKNQSPKVESSPSPFLQIPSLDIGVQDATFELHIAPYGGHWLWGLHTVTSSKTNESPTGDKGGLTNASTTSNLNQCTTNLPPRLCSTIRDTYFTKSNSITDLRKVLGIPIDITDHQQTSTNSDQIKKQEALSPICRAYWKLYEIMFRRPDNFSNLFKNMDSSECIYAIDVGAAPGGWTQFLCDLIPNQGRMEIVAVDPSSLNQKIKELPNVINIQKRSEDAVVDIQHALSNKKSNESEKRNNTDDAKNKNSAFQGFDILVCDANVSPTQTLELIGPIIPLLKKKGAIAVITAKNQFSGGKAGVERVHDLFQEEIEKAKGLYVNAGLNITEVVHLFANSLNETTMMVEAI